MLKLGPDRADMSIYLAEIERSPSDSSLVHW